MGEINICLATPADAPDMAEILMRSWEVAYKEIMPPDVIREKNATRHDLYKRVITEYNTIHYIIQKNEKTVGLVRMDNASCTDLNDSFYELLAIYIHPNYWREGIGSYAMDFILNHAQGLRKTAIIVWVLEKNADAIKFYEKFDFKIDGATTTVDYGEPPLNVVRMRRRL